MAREATNLSLPGIRVPVTFRFGDYRAVNGVVVPHRVEMKNPISGRMVMEYDKAMANVEPEQGAQRSSDVPCCERPPSSKWTAVLKVLARAATGWKE